MNRALAARLARWPRLPQTGESFHGSFPAFESYVRGGLPAHHVGPESITMGVRKRTNWGGSDEMQVCQLGSSYYAGRSHGSEREVAFQRGMVGSSRGRPQFSDVRGGSRVAEGAAPMEAGRPFEHCDRCKRQCLGPAPAADA